MTSFVTRLLGVMIASVIIALIIFLMDQVVDRLMHLIYSFGQ